MRTPGRGPVPRDLALVAAGGAAGTLARWAVSSAVPASAGGPGTAAWPLGTLAVNLFGALALGALMGATATAAPGARATRLRLLLGVGLLGGFTTYSALAVEVGLLAQDAPAASAAGYALVSAVGGVACALAGTAVAGLAGRR